MPSKQEQPTRFAKCVIMELAQIRAQINVLSRHIATDISMRNNIDAQELLAKINAESAAKAKRFYEHYVKEVGLEDKPDNPA